MSFAAGMLALLGRIAESAPLPEVVALHVPPLRPSPAGGSHKVNGFCALELADGSIGFSYLLLGDMQARLRAGADEPLAGVAPGGRLLAGRPALEVAGWYADSDPLRRMLGFAAVNAISQRFFRQADYVFGPADDSLGLLDAGPGDRIAMVGLFGPLLGRIVDSGAELTVLELDPALAGEFDGYRVSVDPGALAGCTKALSTTTILLNGTLDSILGACRGASRLALIGPGGGCLPDPLFARGVTLLGGTAVVDREGLIDAISRGEPWGRFARKYCIRRDEYPGFEVLQEKARGKEKARSFDRAS